jgi:RNA polymerase sigma-70 factor, ECF subfamily
MIPMRTEAEPSFGAFEEENPSWPDLVERLRSGEPAALEDLYRIFAKGIRFFIYRQLGPQDLDDRVHDVFLTVTESILNGELREPERLMGYVRTVVKRTIAAHIDDAVQTRRNHVDLDSGVRLLAHDPTPEGRMIDQQSLELAHRVLGTLHRRDREVLTRFYLDGQTATQICTEMDLSDTQFRLIKSRAKARFAQLGKRRLEYRAKPKW